jgi:hypothetical protein
MPHGNITTLRLTVDSLVGKAVCGKVRQYINLESIINLQL